MIREELIEMLIQEQHLKKEDLNALPTIDDYVDEGEFRLKFIEEFKIRLLFNPKVGLVKVEIWGPVEAEGGFESDWSAYYHYLAK